MYERFDEPMILPYITNVTHTEEGLLVQFSQGATVLYQTGLLWEMREYDASVPVEIVRGLADPPRVVN